MDGKGREGTHNFSYDDWGEAAGGRAQRQLPPLLYHPAGAAHAECVVATVTAGDYSQVVLVGFGRSSIRKRSIGRWVVCVEQRQLAPATAADDDERISDARLRSLLQCAPLCVVCRPCGSNHIKLLFV